MIGKGLRNSIKIQKTRENEIVTATNRDRSSHERSRTITNDHERSRTNANVHGFSRLGSQFLGVWVMETTHHERIHPLRIFFPGSGLGRSRSVVIVRGRPRSSMGDSDRPSRRTIAVCSLSDLRFFSFRYFFYIPQPLPVSARVFVFRYLVFDPSSMNSITTTPI